MSNIKEYLTRAIGTVQNVDTQKISVSVEEEEILNRLKINDLLILSGNNADEKLIGMVTKVSKKRLEFDENEFDPMSEYSSNYCNVTLVGTFYVKLSATKTNIFRRAVNTYPEINSQVYLAESEALSIIMNSLDSEIKSNTGLAIGKYASNKSVEAILDGNKFFQRHASIVGSTGSGKSFTVANILEKANKLGYSNIIVFDLHGEYNELSYAKQIKINDNGGLHIPLWFFNYEEIHSLFIESAEGTSSNQRAVVIQYILENKMKKILLIDGSSLIFRAFYAIRNLTTKDGVFVNGVYGFLNMYYKALELINPTHIFVAFDKGSKTFRHNEFADYKGTRDNAPNEITYQFGILKDLLSSMNVNYLELDKYEADDIIGTIAKLAQKEGFEVDIFTGDRDYLQLVDDNILVYLTKKGISEIKLMNTESILEEYDLSPKQLIDVKALQGDSSDNIPGVKGVGEKTALKLIQEYGNLENLYENIDNLKGKLKENLVNEKDKAYLSRYLGEIFLRVPIERNIEDFEIKDVNYNEYLKKLEKLEFNSIINKHFKDIKKESTVKSNQNIDFEVINFSEIFEVSICNFVIKSSSK